MLKSIWWSKSEIVPICMFIFSMSCSGRVVLCNTFYISRMNTVKFYHRRLLGVKGDGEKKNDVIVCSKSTPEHAKEHVIYFGGDVQDYTERMQRHKDNFRYAEWNLDSTAWLLANRFPDSLVMIVKPKAMFLNTFSIYSNFVEFSETYVPVLKCDLGGLLHLRTLHKNVLKRMCEKPTNSADCCGAGNSLATNAAESNCPKVSAVSEPSENNCPSVSAAKEPAARCYDGIILDSVPEPDHITLVGFSKGCTVLNQFLFELSVDDSDTLSREFVSKFKAIYWLDGGHKGNKNVWVTDDDVLKSLTNLNIKLYAHVTPYQVDDQMRAWIGKQHFKFVDKLKKLGADITSTKHHIDDLPSLENHFDVLNCF